MLMKSKHIVATVIYLSFLRLILLFFFSSSPRILFILPVCVNNREIQTLWHGDVDAVSVLKLLLRWECYMELNSVCLRFRLYLRVCAGSKASCEITRRLFCFTLHLCTRISSVASLKLYCFKVGFSYGRDILLSTHKFYELMRISWLSERLKYDLEYRTYSMFYIILIFISKMMYSLSTCIHTSIFLNLSSSF